MSAFSAAIFAFAVATSVYVLLLASIERGYIRRPRASLLNPSSLGLGWQNVLFAALIWPVVVLRVTAKLYLPAEVLTISAADIARCANKINPMRF